MGKHKGGIIGVDLWDPFLYIYIFTLYINHINLYYYNLLYIINVCVIVRVCVHTWVIMSWEKLLKIYGNDWLGWGTGEYSSICGRKSAPLINQTNSCSPNFGIHLIWKWPLRTYNSMVIRFGGSCLSEFSFTSPTFETTLRPKWQKSTRKSFMMVRILKCVWSEILSKKNDEAVLVRKVFHNSRHKRSKETKRSKSLPITHTAIVNLELQLFTKLQA